VPRILREQAIPVHPLIQVYGSKEVGHCRRRQDHIARDAVGGLIVKGMTSKDSEFPALHVGATDQETRSGWRDVYLVELDALPDQPKKLVPWFKGIAVRGDLQNHSQLPNRAKRIHHNGV
jgi:hypothetical protein